MSLSLTFLFAVMGLSIDLGWDYYLRTRVQTAADAAASAAAVYAKANSDSCGTISCGTTYTCAGVTPATTSLQAGCLYVSNDAPPTFTATMVENDTAPPGVTGNSPSLWVQANVSTTAHSLFLWGQGFHTANINATAVAGITTVPAAACVYVLDATATQALSLSGSSSLTTTGCGVFVNSSASQALYITGASSVTAPKVVVNGTTYLQGSSTVTPTPIKATVTDPLSSLPGPTFSGCNQTNYSISNGNSATLSAGVYCGGISVQDAHVTLNSGVYILNGGGLNVGNTGTLTGSGVMFYNTATSGHTAGPITITGSGAVTLSAPTSGTYQGIAFFQDRSITYSSANSISNAGTGNITGTFYFPTTEFDFTGSTAAAVYAAFIADTIVISGASSLKSDTTGAYTGLAKASVSVIK